MRDYDPAGDAKQKAEDEAADEALDNPSTDPAEAQRIFDKRYKHLTEFEQAQRGFDRHIDEDRLRKIKGP